MAIEVHATNEHLFGQRVSAGNQSVTVTKTGEVLPPKGQEFSATTIARLQQSPHFRVTGTAEKPEEPKGIQEPATAPEAPAPEAPQEEPAEQSTSTGKKAKRLLPEKV